MTHVSRQEVEQAIGAAEEFLSAVIQLLPEMLGLTQSGQISDEISDEA